MVPERAGDQSGPRVTGLRSLAILSGVTVAASVMAIAAYPDRTGAALALVALLTALIVGSAMYPVDPTRPGVLDVAFLAGVVMWLGFGLRTLLLLTGGLDRHSSLAHLPGYGQFGDADLAALAVAVASWVALVIAYRTPLGSRLARGIPTFSIGASDAVGLTATMVAFAAIGWLARVVLFLRYPTPFEHLAPGAMTSGETLLTWLTVLSSVAMTLGLYRVVYVGAGTRGVAIAIALVLGEIIAGLATGSRLIVISTVVTAGVFLTTAGALRLRAWHLLAVPVVLMLYGASWVYRTVSVPEGQPAGVAARAEIALAAISAAGPVGVMQAGAANLVDRYPGVEIVRQIMVLGQPEHLDWGARYLLAVPLAVIPRFLWPDKPVNDLPQEFGVRYLGAPPEANVPIAPTWVGDLALSVPFLLVPVAMMGVGVALRVVNEHGRRARIAGGLTAISYALLVPIVIESDGMIDVQIYIVSRLVAVLIGAAILIALARNLRARGEGHRAAGELDGA